MVVKRSDEGESEGESEDYSFAFAHGTVMILAWMVFASTGILFARYGRLLHIGKKKNLLGEVIWFQAHRIALTLASVATLLGFFFILVQEKGKWISVADEGHGIYAHSILGVLVVCFAMSQVWMALFRCHPEGQFRFIFNWLHRGTGVLAFILSIPTIFLIISLFSKHQNGFYAIMAIWTVWVIFIVILFEFFEFRARSSSKSNSTDENNSERGKESSNDYNGLKLIFLCIHLVVSVALAIPFIVLIWKQKE